MGMTARRGISIRHKLALLAGIPVIGALLLSGLIVRDARHELQSAAALGSVEDLALLATKISAAVHQLQSERALLGRGIGQPPDPQRMAAYAATDHALRDLQLFLDKRDLAKLPPRLTRNLASARSTLAALDVRRKAAVEPESDVIPLLDFYATADSSLIGAIAALTQLSDEGELLRAIAALVCVLQFKESASQEHAVLAHVFEHGEFAPGVYKVLVTLVSEQAGSERSFRQNAGDEVSALFDRMLHGDFMTRTAAMRDKALSTLDDDFGIAAADWMRLQGQKIDALRSLETTLSERIREIARGKLNVLHANMTTSLALAGGVLLTSIVLAWLIARGVTRSVSSLSDAAERVQEHKDFSVRAQVVSHDELGVLTQTFNGMLRGIQGRDAELLAHRDNLEALVNARTAELSERNAAMRIVLDNVEEGLATIRLDGSVARETSASFARWFGAPAPGTTIGAHMQQISPDVGLAFRLGWDAIIEDVFPWELSLDQLPRSLRAHGRAYELTYRPILDPAHANKLQGALLVVSDVTEALERERRAREQQEALSIFGHIMQDRHGFQEFTHEVARLVDITRRPRAVTTAELMRAVHTIKGNCSIFGVDSIAALAHELESFIVEQQQLPSAEALGVLHGAWEQLQARIERLYGGDHDTLELAVSELSEVIESAERRAPYELLTQQLRELAYEPVERRFSRLAERAKALATRLGKPQLQIEQNAGSVRLPVEPWAEFWGAFVHVVRNAVDHGIETHEERDAAHKHDAPKLTLSCKWAGSDCVIEVSDNGRGIAWDRVREKARGLGLPYSTREDLENALFTDGLSTRDEASDTSGRGVGMAAVRAACLALGGQISVISEAGSGTTFRFRVPSASVTRERKVA